MSMPEYTLGAQFLWKCCPSKLHLSCISRYRYYMSNILKNNKAKDTMLSLDDIFVWTDDIFVGRHSKPVLFGRREHWGNIMHLMSVFLLRKFILFVIFMGVPYFPLKARPWKAPPLEKAATPWAKNAPPDKAPGVSEKTNAFHYLYVKTC